MNETKVVKFLAEQVMRWKEKNIKYGTGGTFSHWVREDGTTTNYRIGEWRPVEYISHAWMVVEAMRERVGSREEANFSGKMASYDILSLTPQAICIAATKALATDAQLKGWGL